MSYPNPNYPNYPTYPASTGGFPGAPQPPYPGFVGDQSGANPGYPPNPAPTGPYPSYPGAQPGYPGGQPGYPSGQPGYPGGQPGYPSGQPGYPSAQPGFPSYPAAPLNSQYPPAPAPAPGYPPQPQQPNYPTPTPGYPPQPQQQPSYYPTPGPAPVPASATASAYSQYNPVAPPYNPGAPQQAGYPGGAPVSAPAGPYPSAPGGGYPTAPIVPSSTGINQYATQQPQMEQGIPTVTPVSPFDPRADADVLHRAMKGLGTDEKALISVLCHRTSSQRTAINQAYKSGYGKDLESKLKSELSGNFEKLMVALCLPKADYMAREMHDAISGMGTNEGTLVEILCSGTNHEIREMNTAYVRLYGHPMEKDIKGDTSGVLKMLLVSLAQGQRDENTTVDVQRAKDDAQRLYQAGEAKMGTDESAFNAILATRSWPQIRQIMAEYQALRGNTLEKAVLSEFSANAEKGLLGILQCAQNRPAYFAQRANNAIRGMGTKDNNLIRIIVSRSDIDLASVKREYEKKYGRSLITDVSGDTSGDYKKGLLALLG